MAEMGFPDLSADFGFLFCFLFFFEKEWNKLWLDGKLFWNGDRMEHLKEDV